MNCLGLQLLLIYALRLGSTGYATPSNARGEVKASAMDRCAKVGGRRQMLRWPSQRPALTVVTHVRHKMKFVSLMHLGDERVGQIRVQIL